jgi:phage shock protein A
LQNVLKEKTKNLEALQSAVEQLESRLDKMRREYRETSEKVGVLSS